MKVNKNIIDYNEDNEESNSDDNEYKDIEGDNIVIRNKKKKIKKDLNNFDIMQKEMKKYEGKNISYNKLQNNSNDEEEEIEENEEELDNEEEEVEQEEQEQEEEEEKEKEDNSKENELNSKPNILNINKDEEEEKDEKEEDNEEGGENEEINEENNEENSDENNELTLQEKMEKQDEKYLKTLSKVTKDEIRKAKNILNQKELYETFVGIRIALQNLLSDINSLPSYINISKFISSSSPETQNFYSKVKNNLDKTFFNSLIFHKEFLKKQSYPSSEQFNPVEEFDKILKKLKNNNENDNMDIDEEKEEKENINKQLNMIHNNLFKIDQKIMNIWYRKTVVNQFQTNNKILKKL